MIDERDKAIIEEVIRKRDIVVGLQAQHLFRLQAQLKAMGVQPCV